MPVCMTVQFAICFVFQFETLHGRQHSCSYERFWFYNICNQVVQSPKEEHKCVRIFALMRLVDVEDSGVSV